VGQIRGSNRFIFSRRSVSVMIAEGETSLPVPAVAGTAMVGSGSAASSIHGIVSTPSRAGMSSADSP
jgi:hypothetical protein